MFNEAGLFFPSCGGKKQRGKKEFYYSFREQLQCIGHFKLTIRGHILVKSRKIDDRLPSIY